MEELNLQENPITVEIKFQGIFEDTFTKKLLFAVTTKENHAEYKKFRNTQDFLFLRTQMLKKWVSFVVPHFPKVTFSMMKSIPDQKINNISKYLQEFLDSCVSNSEIFSCSDMQLFLKGPENYIENSRQIQTDYKEIFNKLSYRSGELPEVSLDHSAISTQHQHYKTCLIELKELKTKIKALNSVFRDIQVNQKLAFFQFEKVEQTYLDRLGEMNRHDFMFESFGNEKNPYEDILEWITRECYKVKSVLEEIEKFLVLYKAVEATERKISKKKEEVRTLESGKRPLSAIFIAKGHSEITSKYGSDLTGFEDQASSMNSLLRLLYLHLMTKTLPEMESKRLERYQSCMEIHSLGLISCFAQKIT